MISKLTGTVSHRGKDFVLLDVGPVGYRVCVPEFALPHFHGDMTLFTHEVQREDAHELFGFLDIEALELFWKLIAISGVGPKGAQKIVFAGSAGDVRKKIMDGNVAFLQSVPGIGHKTAQKIVLELRGALSEEDRGEASVNADALEALLGLGYRRAEALKSLEGLEGSAEEQVKTALQSLARR